MDGGAGQSCDRVWQRVSVNSLKAVQVVRAGLRFCPANVLLQSQQTPTQPHTNSTLPMHTPNDRQSPHLRHHQPGKAPADAFVCCLHCHLIPLFMPFHLLFSGLTHSFIAAIPFLSLTAPLICSCVYNGNPLHGSTETESSGWERERGRGDWGRSPRFMEGHSGAHLTIPAPTLIKQREVRFDGVP